MKKVTLLFAMVLMGLTSATANESSVEIYKDLDITSRYQFSQPILFVERGVEFLIFADGSFDFNTDFIGNSTRPYTHYRIRRGVNRSFGAPGVRSRHFGSRGVLVTHDRLGRVRRLGNVFINYDRQGLIKRAGSVYMRYRQGLLKQVGNLRLQYNLRGRLIGTTGQVNFSNPGSGICGVTGNTVNHNNFHNLNHWNNNDIDIDLDDDFYYYRQDGTVKKQHKLRR